MQLFDGHGDLQVVAQHVKGGQDVCPLNHLPQGPALQDLRAEHVSGLLRQEAHVDQDLRNTRARLGTTTLFIEHFSYTTQTQGASHRNIVIK